jgi:transcriptional regulator with XRE-family HTH domain
VESLFKTRNVTFEDLQERLVRLVRRRISNGEFTERGLARIAGISQPQIHNFLKGARKLSPEFADRLMLRFGIGILDLFEPRELLEQAAIRGAARVSPDVSDLKKPVQSAESLHPSGDYFGSRAGRG